MPIDEEREAFVARLKRLTVERFAETMTGVKVANVEVRTFNEGSNVGVTIVVGDVAFVGAARLSSGISTVQSEIRALGAKGAADYVWTLMRFDGPRRQRNPPGT